MVKHEKYILKKNTKNKNKTHRYDLNMGKMIKSECHHPTILSWSCGFVTHGHVFDKWVTGKDERLARSKRVSFDRNNLERNDIDRKKQIWDERNITHHCRLRSGVTGDLGLACRRCASHHAGQTLRGWWFLAVRFIFVFFCSLLKLVRFIWYATQEALRPASARKMGPL